jgi:hypothetical protein
MPSWENSELLREAVSKIGGDQRAFAELVTLHTQYKFNQSQISKLCRVQRRINNANKLAELMTVVEKVLAGKLNAPSGSKSDRYSQESKETGRAAKVEFWTAYPYTYERDFARATALSISGLDLRRLHGHIGDLKEVIRRQGSVRIILLDPEYYELCRYGTMQDWGKKSSKSVEVYRDSIWTTYEIIRSVMRTGMAAGKTKQRNKRLSRSSGTLEIRALRYPLGFGIDFMTFEDANDGAIYVRHYPMYAGVEDRPIVPLTTADGYWYSFYKEQFEIHWRNAVPWTNDKERTWKDLRHDRPRSK